MEIEQFVKRVDWLDDERRKDKNVLASLEARMTALEGNLPAINQQLNSFSGEITRLGALISRMDHFDEALLKNRIEVNQSLEEIDKQIKKREGETEKVRQVEMRAIDTSLVEIRKELAQIGELKRGMQARLEEENRLGRLIDEVHLRIEAVRRMEEEYTRSVRLMEDGRRQDTKRLADLQGEVAALRKRADDQRGQSEVLSASFRKVETKLSELASLETERREAQLKFLENQALIQVERERVWKEWQVRFETIEKQTAEVETNLQTLDATHRTVKRAQQSLEELTQKIDRRISEMTEIQRLAEERFRQDWVTFKADDQKRWTNYTLTQEEQRGELVRQQEKLAERVTQLEDSLQEIQDIIHQMNEQTEKRLQSMLAMVHEWVAAYERTIGKAR